jgi:DNA-binding NarL/FixJ family response regulator
MPPSFRVAGVRCHAGAGIKHTLALDNWRISSFVAITTVSHLNHLQLCMKKTQVLIIDEHPNVRRALAARLATTPHIQVMATAAGLQEGLSVAALKRPDVVLLGLRTQDELRDTAPIQRLSSELATFGASLIVLTTYAVDEERMQIMDAGAKRYLLKNIDSRRLIAEINALVPKAPAVR